MKKKEENKQKAVPVMKQLARVVTKKELASVAGGRTGSIEGVPPNDKDYDRPN